MTDKKDSESEPKLAAKASNVNDSALVSKNDTSQGANQTSQSEEKIEPTSPDNLFSAKPMPKMQSKKRKLNWLIPGITGVLVVLAILIASWTFYQQTLFNQNWADQQTKIDQQLNQQKQIIEQAKKSGDTSVQSANQTQLQLAQLITKNKQLQESLLSTQERIKALSGRQKQDWMLAEAAYLIKAAQLQLSLQKDKSTAIQLLKTADSRIIEIADHGLLPIREAIAKDLSNLALILELDITGIALTLDAINKQIPNLSLLALEFEPLEKSLNTDTKEKTDEGFNLENIYQSFLADFVIIKDHSEPVKPLMTTDQRVNLNSNIQLAIQQAQIALLQGNETLYQLNIENAIQWTDEFFKNDETGALVIKQLDALKTKPIEVHFPQKLDAQKAIEEISQQQLYRWLESSISPPVSNIAAEILKSNSLDTTKSEPKVENTSTKSTSDTETQQPLTEMENKQ